MKRSSQSSCKSLARAPAVLLSLLVPGSGLILARRGGLGFAIALLFTLALQLAWWGTWLVPESLAGWMTSLGWFLAALSWLAGQVLTWRRWAALASPDVGRQMGSLLAEARRALSAGKLDEARLALELARTVDDEDKRVDRLWSELQTRLAEQPQRSDQPALASRPPPGT